MLSGVVPAGLIPVYAIPIVLQKVERFEVPARVALSAPLATPLATPLWTFDAGSAIWAGRAVAVKVLPEAFAGDPARMARFEREARLLASLNHPYIASI